jgi:hypothetical protein
MPPDINLEVEEEDVEDEEDDITDDELELIILDPLLMRDPMSPIPPMSPPMLDIMLDPPPPSDIGKIILKVI